MRQRKLKNEEERLIAYNRYMPENPQSVKGKWQELFGNENDIFIELGCGKGKFITEMAQRHHDRNYIGIEGQGSVILRALEKAAGEELTNVLFINSFIEDVTSYFDKDELSGIYLNFSDPWPKKRHERKRLVHERYLEGYTDVLRAGGSIELKTDNEGLYGYMKKNALSKDMKIITACEDLHASLDTAKEVTTEYEEKFKQMGRKIFYCKVTAG